MTSVDNQMGEGVLCISRNALSAQGVPSVNFGMYPFDLEKVGLEAFQFFDRAIVDDKAVGANSDIGIQNPQVLGYIIVRHGDEVLTYARKHSPNEQRLLGSRSLGFGGHADGSMFSIFEEFADNVFDFINHTAARELKEELELPYEIASHVKDIKQVIIDMRDNTDPAKLDQVAVGKVHMGYVMELWLKDKSIVKSTKEAQDLKWVTTDGALTADRDLYESWSQILMDNYLVQLHEGV